MIESYMKMFTNFADFTHRTSRRDYWQAFLVNLVILVPGISMCARRLHDVNKTGWFMLIELIPVVGTIILLIYLASASVDEGNKYGDEVV